MKLGEVVSLMDSEHLIRAVQSHLTSVDFYPLQNKQMLSLDPKSML